jgi:hypothetical protein
MGAFISPAAATDMRRGFDRPALLAQEAVAIFYALKRGRR